MQGLGLLLIFVSISCPCLTVQVDFKYHKYDALTKLLRSFNETYPQLTKLYSIGRSVRGNELWVLRIQSPTVDPLAPNVKIIANMHGDESVGREVVLHFAQVLLSGYIAGDPEVTWLLNRTIVHLLPSLNPDGFERSIEGVCSRNSGRANWNHRDLNRDFPDPFQNVNSGRRVEAETAAVIDWLNNTQFVLSANLHGGALVVVYPYDSNIKTSVAPEGRLPAHLTPDNDFFVHLATTYVHHNPRMKSGICSSEKMAPQFPGGITNGAAWYSLVGGMQDYNYAFHGCMETVIEMSCCKYPLAKDLPTYWEENKNAIFAYLRESQRGVRGWIRNAKGVHISSAVLFVLGREKAIFKSDQNGRYWRLLLPGKYKIQVSYASFLTAVFSFTVQNAYEPTVLNITLLTPADVNTVPPTTITQKEVTDDDDIMSSSLSSISSIVVTDSTTSLEMVDESSPNYDVADDYIGARAIISNSNCSQTAPRINAPWLLFLLILLFLHINEN